MYELKTKEFLEKDGQVEKKELLLGNIKWFFLYS